MLTTFKTVPLCPVTLHTRRPTLPSRCSLSNPQPFSNSKPTQIRFRLLCGKNQFGFRLKAQDGGTTGGGGERKGVEGEDEVWDRGESTMPDRFRYLTKEVPDPSLRWPWFVALGFLIYAWRAVLFELSNWRSAVLATVGFVGYLLKLFLALVFHFIGDPITYLISGIETLLYTIRVLYSGIVRHAPVPELTMIIILASAVLSVAEAAVPNSVSCQPYLLTLSGLIGYAAVKNYISEPLFWTLLFGVYAFSQLIKKRDEVTSALPAATVLAAVGQPWIRILIIGSYTALAISHHSKKPLEQQKEVEVETTGGRVPLPLLAAALAIGIHLAAKWAGYRHLTWMIA